MKNRNTLKFREQIQEVLKVDLLEGIYYFQKEDVFLKSNIKGFEIIKNSTGEEDLLDIELDNGHIGICECSKVTKINRPPNISLKFDWCFSIRNTSGELIGYIGKPTE